jgi:RNA polymerase sigma-70 factor (ECF subfamily)
MLQAVTDDASHAPPDAVPDTGSEASSLEAFLDAVGPRAFRFAEVSLRQREDALDVVQEAMVRLLRYRARPAEEWSPLFWRILRSRIVDAQRRRGSGLRWLSPAPADGPAPDWADDGPDPSRTHDGREAWTRLSSALARLPRRQREAFTLRVLEELDVAETALAMGCSEGSVKTHLSRARQALQRALEDWR